MNAAIPMFRETVVEPKAPESLFTDLGPFLDGTAEQVLPTVAKVWERRYLFYPEAVNEIHGEPATGKTNALLNAAGLELAHGGRVLYIDPEDTPRRMVARARSLGLSCEAMRVRFHYLHNPAFEEYARAHQWSVENRPTLVVIDGLAEALAAEGKDENSPTDVLGFFRERVRPFAEAGAAVVIADHVTKGAEGRGRWPRGSGAKLGRYDGVSYEILMGEPYTPDKPGFVKLRVSKDRPGGVGAQGVIVAELHFEPGQGGTTATWREPEAKGEFRPTAIMDKIVTHLRAYHVATTTDLRTLGKAAYVDLAIRLLLKEGTITLTKEGRKHCYRLAEKSVNGGLACPVSQPVPRESRT